MKVSNRFHSRAVIVAIAISGLSLVNSIAQAPAGAATPAPGAPKAANALTNQLARPAVPARPSWEEKLTEDQRKAYREARETAQTQTRDVYEKMRTARNELQQEVYADKLDEVKLKEKANALGKLEGDIALIQANSFAKYRQFLPADQLARMKGGFAPRTNRLDAVPPIKRVGTNAPARPVPATN